MCLPGKTALPNHSLGWVPYSFSLVDLGEGRIREEKCRLGLNLLIRVLFFVHGRIDPDAAFRLSIQISQFLAKMEDGSSVDVPRKCYEWIVDYRCYTMLSLEKDLAERVGFCSNYKRQLATHLI